MYISMFYISSYKVICTYDKTNWLGGLLKTCRSLSNGGKNKEKTLAIIKPDGLLGNYTDDIKKTILESGFCILKEKRVQLDEDTAASFYAEHSSKNFFASLIKYMTRYFLDCLDVRLSACNTVLQLFWVMLNSLLDLPYCLTKYKEHNSLICSPHYNGSLFGSNYI